MSHEVSVVSEVDSVVSDELSSLLLLQAAPTRVSAMRTASGRHSPIRVISVSIPRCHVRPARSDHFP